MGKKWPCYCGTASNIVIYLFLTILLTFSMQICTNFVNKYESVITYSVELRPKITIFGYTIYVDTYEKKERKKKR